MKDWRIIFGVIFVVLFFISTHALASETYRVKKGDTLVDIAKKNRVSVSSLKQANKLSSDKLSVNQVLVIPGRGQNASARASSSSGTSARASSGTQSQRAIQTKTYTVKKGDTLQKIAKTTGVSVSDIRSQNQLRDNTIKPGQKLVLKQYHAVATARESRSTTPQTASHGNTYTVQKGDTLQKIAGAAGISVADLKSLNQLHDDNIVIPGQKLVLRQEPAIVTASADTESHVQRILDGAEQLAPAAGEAPSLPLGRWEDSKERERLVKISKGFIGAPYRFGGASLTGIDCSAFVKRIYSIFDITLPRTAREQANVGQKVSRDELTVGDLVFFNTRRHYISHVGIYIGEGQFVHASSGRSKEVRINSLNEPYYDKRFVRATRLKDLESQL